MAAKGGISRYLPRSIPEWPLFIFVISLGLFVIFLSFTYGFISGKYQVFPYAIIRDIAQTARGLTQLAELRTDERSSHEIPAPFAKGGVTVNRAGHGADQLTFVTLFRDGRYGARLIDGDGKAVHRWRVPYEEAGLLKATDTDVALSIRNKHVHGAHLYENGDVLLVVEYTGLIKLDAQSNVLWAVREPIHHAIAFDGDGSIWALSRQSIDDPEKAVARVSLPYWDDRIVRVSPNGSVIETWSVLDIIKRNRFEGILYGGHPKKPEVDHEDPLHLNDIDVLSADAARRFDGVDAGDLMLSMRTINTVFILDRDTMDIKWSMTGPFLRQHDPAIGKDGFLYVFDNRTASGQIGNGAVYLSEPQVFGYSRILKIDPGTRAILWERSGSRDWPFYTSIMGGLEPLANGNLLVVESEGGRVIELDPETDRIVWEYVNLLEPGWVGRVSDALRYSRDQLDFLGSG